MENWHRTGHIWILSNLGCLLSTPYSILKMTRASDISWLFGEHRGFSSQHPIFVDPTSAHFSYVVKSPIQILIFLGQIWHVAQSPSFSWSNHIKSISVSKSNQPFCHAPPPFSARPRCHAAAHRPHSLYEVALLVQLRGEFHRVVRHDTHLLRCDQMINGLVLLGKS